MSHCPCPECTAAAVPFVTKIGLCIRGMFQKKKDPTEFGELPVDVFQNILSYLPIEDRLRSKRVSKYWQENCQRSITSDPGTIRFGDSCCERMPRDQLINLLDSCGNRLRGVVFSSTTTPKQLFKAEKNVIAAKCFAQRTFPKLKNLEIEGCLTNRQFVIHQVEGEFIRYILIIISRCPKLQSISSTRDDRQYLHYELPGIYPISADLVSINLGYSDCLPEFFSWLPDQCKNLKSISCGIENIDVNDQSDLISNLRKFFGRCRRLNRIHIEHNPFNSTLPNLIKNVPEFWSLPMLTTMQFTDELYDDFVIMAANAFPQLEEFSILRGRNLTNTGVISLARMHHLRRLKIYGAFADISAGISKIAENGSLVELKLQLCNTGNLTCIMSIIRLCNGLRDLEIVDRIYQESAPTIGQRISLLQSMKSFVGVGVGRQLTMQLMGENWDNEIVRQQASDLFKIDHGHRFKGHVGKRMWR